MDISITVLWKITKECMNSITSVGRKEKVDTIKNVKMVKTLRVPKFAILDKCFETNSQN